ncbi:hypothetical protein [Chamaesiphon minutus]|uniref:Uncharacterized protein n=1 Tax=Chamaesiphon minutus (strain ATCC 27169 / PCC 6605) TaxID=1173020 RepID=K9UHL2_CHAP6|nr:hypothetical protein [Chamaesiphon minutus]AFY93936.1 hypothetical protein Cha6605_2903 [Chamaesiphon minutus PCC 6605]
MNLDQQVQALIDGAPDVESRLSVTAIAPILQQFAATLPHITYYICQSPQGEWVITTLRNQLKPNLEIQVMYAFTSVEDVQKFNSGLLASSLAIEVPVIQLIFYLLAFPEIDRLVFLNDSEDLNKGQEITRDSLEESIARKLDRDRSSQLPPDVC